MTLYVKIEKGVVAQYPYTYRQLRLDHPDTSFPREPGDWLAGWGVYPVAETDPPAHTLTHDPVEVDPVEVDGVWVQTWKIVTVDQVEADRRAAEQTETETRLAENQIVREYISTIKADSFVQNFVKMTPAELDAHIDANLTNISSAKAIIGKLAKMVLVLARSEFR